MAEWLTQDKPFTGGYIGPLERRMAQWCAAVQKGHPLANPHFIEATCKEVFLRAVALGAYPGLDVIKVATFLLDRSEAWVFAGEKIDKIVPRLPRTATELGLLKMSEGGPLGQPLPQHELNKARVH